MNSFHPFKSFDSFFYKQGGCDRSFLLTINVGPTGWQGIENLLYFCVVFVCLCSHQVHSNVMDWCTCLTPANVLTMSSTNKVGVTGVLFYQHMLVTQNCRGLKTYCISVLLLSHSIFNKCI